MILTALDRRLAKALLLPGEVSWRLRGRLTKSDSSFSLRTRGKGERMALFLLARPELLDFFLPSLPYLQTCVSRVLLNLNWEIWVDL